MSGLKEHVAAFVGARRAVTVNDAIAVGTLLVLSLVLSAGLGASIVFLEDERTGPPSANFTYQHFSTNSMLIVTHNEGDAIQASQLVVESDETKATWATIADANNSSKVAPGDSISLSENSPFGKDITTDDSVTIEWTDGNQTKVLSRWPREEEP